MGLREQRFAVSSARIVGCHHSVGTLEQHTEWRIEANRAASAAAGLLEEAQLLQVSQFRRRYFLRVPISFSRIWNSVDPEPNDSPPAAKFTDNAKPPPHNARCAPLKWTMAGFGASKPNGGYLTALTRRAEPDLKRGKTNTSLTNANAGVVGEIGFPPLHSDVRPM